MSAAARSGIAPSKPAPIAINTCPSDDGVLGFTSTSTPLLRSPCPTPQSLATLNANTERSYPWRSFTIRMAIWFDVESLKATSFFSRAYTSPEERTPARSLTSLGGSGRGTSVCAWTRSAAKTQNSTIVYSLNLFIVILLFHLRRTRCCQAAH